MFETLNVDLAWKSGDLVPFLPIVVSLVFFIIYWFVAQSPIIKKRFYDKYDFDQAAFKHIFFTKIFGFVAMGIIPVTICVCFLDIPFAKYGLTFIPETTMFSLAWIIGLSVLVIPLVHFSARKAKNLVNYPQVRSKVWTKKMVYMNAIGWFLYLFGYEFLFRGVLLIPLVDPEFGIGIWPAIAVNIALYSATHIPKGLDETVGAIPLGLVLCLLTLASGTIWIAFIVHVAMAWTNFFTALKFNPETNYVKK
jgi:membrane protease YdiL (CAAX protease family)